MFALLNDATFMLRDKVHFPFSFVTITLLYFYNYAEHYIHLPIQPITFPLVAMQHPAANHIAHNCDALLLLGNCLCRAPVTIALTRRRSAANIHAPTFYIQLINLNQQQHKSIDVSIHTVIK